MRIEKLKYFMDLYECGSYTETAQKNFISQTTVSQYIRSLEDTFGTILFDRKVTPVTPTEAGNLLYHEALILYQQYQNMFASMNNYVNLQSETIKIAYATLVDIHALLPYTIAFKKLYPGHEVTLHKIALKDSSDLLEKGLYDIAIAFDSEFTQTSAVSIPLYSGTYAAAIGFNHPLYQNDFITTETLYQYPFIMLSPDSIGKSYPQMIAHAEQDGYQIKIAKTVPNLETELFTIISENLIGFVPDNYDMAQFKDQLKLIPIKGSHHKFSIVASYLPHSLNPAIETFIGLIKDPLK